MRSRFWSSSAAVAAVTVATAGMAAAAPAHAAAASRYVAPANTKINVMGEWAHPDDDTSIVGPCGVWHERYGTRCGIIQVTRGEGGGNAVGTEQGPALGLRRENEDRTAHYRSGTVDIFNLDRVDFFYNQSAPLTSKLWNDTDTLRRIVRIIRQTQPDIYVGFTPALAAGHGNHQDAGRYIWEGFKDAADPHKFSGQLHGPHALSTWQVKKVFSGATTADSSANGYEQPTGSGGSTGARNCTTGFKPAGLDNVSGVSESYASPYRWPAGNIQHRSGAKSWAQVGAEGSVAYPTQSRVMFQDVAPPACPRFAMTDNVVPFQPNVLPNGTVDAMAGDDGAILDGASRRDPGGTPLGTLEYLTFSRFYNAPGTPFTATLHVRSGRGTLAAGHVTLHVPTGWRVDRASKAIAAATTSRMTTVRFTVTPATDARVETDFRISAMWRTGAATGYTDQVVQTVPPAEGRFLRFGNWREYDHWLAHTAPQAQRLGRSQAVASVGAGRTLTVPVVVHNWSTRRQRGRVSLTLPKRMSATTTSKPYGPLPAGASTTVRFEVDNAYTDATLPTAQTVAIPIATTNSDRTGTGTDTLSVGIVPTTTIPTVATAPTVDGRRDASYDRAPTLDIGRIWQDATGCRTGADCGLSSKTSTSPSYAKAVQHGDALYVFTHIRDDYQAYAVTPAECFAHWESDSVEFQIDPRGNSSRRLTDTGSTFKLGVFPYTNDPHNRNGNGRNGPCWERDADQHYGFSTGPLANTVRDAPNAPGVQVASTAKWVGSNATTVDHHYRGGGYDLEVKIPLADLPARVNPHHLGLNITPYDNDDTAAAGTTVLRHIDMSTRLGWSAFGSVQSDPYHWGVASIAGYTPGREIARKPLTSPAPIVSHSNLDGVQSPETIAQSARDGVPISGRAAAPAGDRITSVTHTHGPRGTALYLRASGAGTVHVFLWAGDVHSVPVWTTSCPIARDPAPDHGFSSCKRSDGGIPPWGTNMGGRILSQETVALGTGTRRLTFALSARAQRRLAHGGRALISFETRDDRVQALDVALGRRPGKG